MISSNSTSNIVFQLTDRPAIIYDTWAAASRIIPLVNRVFFRVNDLHFSPEGCIYEGGFLSLEQFFAHPPLKGSGIISVKEYGSTVIKNRPFNGITPMDVADNLDRLAQKTLNNVKNLRETVSGMSRELLATLTDMESMAYLGRYYADKIRGAAQLAVYRADPERKDNLMSAVRYLKGAVEEWESYARIALSQYYPQLFSRTYYMDWQKILEDVKKEAQLHNWSQTPNNK